MPAKIRLCQVLEATVGGTRRHLLDLCLHLPRERFEQHLVCSLRRNPDFARDVATLQAAGVEVTVIPMRRQPSPLSDWACLRQLRALLRRLKPQIIHSHSAKAGFLARLAARPLSGVRSVYTPHGFPFQMRGPWWQRGMYAALEQYAGGFTDRLVAVCPSQRDLALRNRVVAPERVVVIRNGIRAETYQVTIDRGAYRERLGLPADSQVVGTVAALSPQKGLETLITAVGQARGRQPDLHLAIAGDGPLRKPLERLACRLQACDLVHFAGWRSDIPQFLASLDVFVLPSRWEGLPYALLEAGAAGVPVIASRIPGNADLIVAGETGRLFAPDDPDGLAQCLVEALADPDSRRLADNLRLIVTRDYTIERMVAEHARLYEGLV